MSEKKLKYYLIKVDQLVKSDFEEMFVLMEENYNKVSYDRFFNDLMKKQYAGILRDEGKKIKGFTTFSINPNNSGEKEYSLIFSGDTIIAPSHWGTLELVKGWCHSVAQISLSHPEKKWYWYLLSKGHRTYMYLPLFFKSYYPSINGDEAGHLSAVLEESSLKIYPSCYVPNSGKIIFPEQVGELKPNLAQGTFDKKKKKHVQFFLEMNENFHKGDELICIAEISPENMHGYGLKYLLEGLEKGSI